MFESYTLHNMTVYICSYKFSLFLLFHQSNRCFEINTVILLIGMNGKEKNVYICVNA